MANVAPTNLNLFHFRPQFARKVAVIGAGAAGLVAAHELRREGHKVVVFEKDRKIGGTWVYTSAIESDSLGIDPGRTVVHTSLYESLRTNLPRELMGFRVYPFVAVDGSDRDPRMYPGHREVLMYLEDFATEFGITELVRFGSEVSHVGMMDGGKWVVRSTKGGDQLDEVYDAVVVCNGHYTEPRIAEIPGIETWPGKQMHSHNYRAPDPFVDQVVIIIGSSASAADISREVAEFAREVHIASRSADDGSCGKLPGFNNLWLHQMIERVHEDGYVYFRDGSAVRTDIIMHCTGYKYHFPFLDTDGIVSVDDNRVGPLYKHIFPPRLSPGLSFIGLPWKVAPFPLFELQSRWMAGVLSGRIPLPSPSDMMADVESFFKAMEASGIPKRYTHNMGDCWLEYSDWLANECGSQPTEEWRKKMYFISSEGRKERPGTYRDEWDDEDSLREAHEDFVKYRPSGGINGHILQ